jgi:hypothetical protein
MSGGPPANPSSPRYRVWTGLDALVQVFYIDDNGNLKNFNGLVNDGNPDPVVGYCFFQNTSLNSEVPYTRRPVTGRDKKRIITDIDEWELTVEHFYMGRYYESDPLQIFAREKKLSLHLSLINPERPDDQEIQVLQPAQRIACNISGQENGIFQGSAKFAAEELSWGLATIQ